MSFHQAISRLPKLLQLPATLLTMPKTIAKEVKTLNELQSVSLQLTVSPCYIQLEVILPHELC